MTVNTINDAQTIAGNSEGTLLANRYRIVRQLGQGGMGSVWLAEDTQLDNKLFAIKMLPSILVSNKRAYRQLKDEALVAMQLVHTNIVQIRAFEDNNGNPFLVMDYIDGQTLDDYLAEHTGTTGILPVANGLPESDVLRLLRPIAAALDYAHSKGVVHRDVKPGNVMIAKDGTPYILDFGIAREIQETMTRVTGKFSSGTLMYMSPEQNNGDEPTPAQDIYSFAAMAYECLTGKPPFSRGNIEYQIMNTAPAPLTGNAAILAAGVMAGLAKKPEARPVTCMSILEGRIAPNSLQAGEGVSSRAAIGDLHLPRQRVPQKIKKGEGVSLKHDKVQLWEGGPYWADTNIGADKPWEYGYYFWWGDTIGYKRENNTWVGSDGSSLEFSPDDGMTSWETMDKNIATLQSEGWITADEILSSEYDAAQVQWGGGWRMPTRKELDDLICKCDWIWTKMNGINGWVIHGRGDYASASIFLPAAGSATFLTNYSGFPRHNCSEGCYWSSVPSVPIELEDLDENVDKDIATESWCLYLCYSGERGTSSNDRSDGLPIRPVQGFTK